MRDLIRLSPPQSLLCRALAGAFAGDTHQAAGANVRALRQDPLWEDLVRLARANEVEAVLGHEVAAVDEPDGVLATWQRGHAETQRRVGSYLAELDRIAALLAAEGIRLVALKNGGIARGIHDCPGCCPMGDLDVLVERRHFRRAHQILLEDGYNFAFRNPLEKAEATAAERNGGAEYWKLLPDGERLWLELQWRPVAGRWLRPDQEPSAEDLIARSIPMAGTAVRLLAPEDNLLQVALHTAKHSYVRAPGFRLHLDVERIVRRYPTLNWTVFCRRVRSLQVTTPVYFSLAIPKQLFGTPIPEWVLAALRPPAWKERLIARWLNRVGLFNPDERKFGRAGYILFTMLLYDDLAGLLRALFPARAYMRERYGCHRDLLLPYYHGRRLFDLARRRLNP